MKIHIKSATVIDNSSKYHLQTVDIIIENGVITSIEKDLPTPENASVISLENLHVSAGWFDASVSLGEPGFEDRETIEHGLLVAAKSGITQIGLNSNCFPKIDNKALVAYVQNKSLNSPVTIHPIGSLTKNSEGNDIAELYDMFQNGAIAFGDYKKSISNANTLKIALQYAKIFNGIVFSYPNTNSIAGDGDVNEGINSTKLGLKGIPTLAETLQIARDLLLLEYTEGRLHIPTISTKESVALIREAKAKGLNVTCSVSAMHLTLTDDVLVDFNSNHKIQPPLRTSEDTLALIEGLKDNTIDFIVSDHNPIDIENKMIEFNNAKYGSIAMESLFTSLNTVLPLELIITKLTTGPKQIFNIQNNRIDIGEKAELSLFNPEGNGSFEEKQILSSSKNSAYLNHPTKGSVYGTIHHNHITLL